MILNYSKIGQLRKLLQNMESTTQEILKKYEKEIANLNQQVLLAVRNYFILKN